jgi:hypothetical protein
LPPLLLLKPNRLAAPAAILASSATFRSEPTLKAARGEAEHRDPLLMIRTDTPKAHAETPAAKDAVAVDEAFALLAAEPKLRPRFAPVIRGVR